MKRVLEGATVPSLMRPSLIIQVQFRDAYRKKLEDARSFRIAQLLNQY